MIDRRKYPFPKPQEAGPGAALLQQQRWRVFRSGCSQSAAQLATIRGQQGGSWCPGTATDTFVKCSEGTFSPHLSRSELAEDTTHLFHSLPGPLVNTSL